MKLVINMLHALYITVAILSMCSCASTTPSKQTAELIEISAPPATHHTAIWSSNTTQVWHHLLQQSSAKLNNLLQMETSDVNRAWIELALIAKRQSTNTSQLTQQLIAWRERYPQHPGNQLLPSNESLLSLENTPQPQHIAVLIPEQGKLSKAAQAIKEGFLNAYYEYPKNGDKQTVKFYDTTKYAHIASVYQQAILDGADTIVGPLSKFNVQELSSTGSITAPTLALNYTDAQSSLPRQFYEFGLLPEDEAIQIAERAKAAGYKRAIVIAPQNAWGHRLVNALSTHWQHGGGQIQETWFFSKQADFNVEVANLLQATPATKQAVHQKPATSSGSQTQRRQDFDVIFLFAQPHDGYAIVPLLKFYYAGNTAIYASSSIYLDKNRIEKNRDLDGVTICDIPWNTRVSRSNTDPAEDDRLYALGQDAYLLSQNIQRLSQLPRFPIYASTGALVLTKQQQIHRHLPCTTILNGQT
jgi:outer membrane PBP1 activator LpoA protein